MLKTEWETKKFSDVLDIRNGRNQKAVESESGTYPILGSAGNIMGYATDYICEAGTTIIGRKGNISTPIYVETKFWNVDTAFGLSPKAGLHNRFLYYYCLSYDFAALNRGTTIPSLVKSELLEISIPLPPLPEQTRIVAILDEAFANISQAVANAEKNLANARELFDSYLNEVFTRKGEGWIRTTIGEQLSLQRGFDITKNQQEDGDIPVVSSGGIKSHHNIGKVLPPGVVIGRKGSLGTVYYLETQYWPHDTTLWVKDFKGNNQKLIYYFFRSLDVKKLDTGTANPALNRNLIHPIKVNWPLYSIQQDLVRTLDDAQNNCKELEDVYRRKLAALAELKQALLQKAFMGELTAN